MCHIGGILRAEFSCEFESLSPELLDAVEAKPIPNLPPSGFPSSTYFNCNSDAECQGGIPQLMHGYDWDGTQDLAGWYLFFIVSCHFHFV